MTQGMTVGGVVRVRGSRRKVRRYTTRQVRRLRQSSTPRSQASANPRPERDNRWEG
jgi:hypothetical protein